MQHEQLLLSGTMFVSTENRTCYGGYQSQFEDRTLTYGLSSWT